MIPCGDQTRYEVLVPGDGIISAYNIERLIIKSTDLCVRCTHHRLWHHNGGACGDACPVHCREFVTNDEQRHGAMFAPKPVNREEDGEILYA